MCVRVVRRLFPLGPANHGCMGQGGPGLARHDAAAALARTPTRPPSTACRHVIARNHRPSRRNTLTAHTPSPMANWHHTRARDGRPRRKVITPAAALRAPAETTRCLRQTPTPSVAFTASPRPAGLLAPRASLLGFRQSRPSSFLHFYNTSVPVAPDTTRRLSPSPRHIQPRSTTAKQTPSMHWYS